MAKFRKLLALVLVMAMTFTMLPVFAAAEDAVGTIDRLSALHRENEEKLADVPARSARNVRELFSYIEGNPILETGKTAEALGISRNSAARYIEMFCERGILENTGKTGKTRIYAYTAYLDILKKDTQL